jgi:hypothetical protein
VAGLDQLEVGQRFMTIFQLVSFEDGRSITIDSDTAALGRVAVTYTTVPAGSGRCRLVVKVVFQTPRGPIGRALKWLLPAGDLVMMRRQLLTLKALSERDAVRLGPKAPTPRSGDDRQPDTEDGSLSPTVPHG